MRPTLKELEELFWTAVYTGAGSGLSLLIAPNVTGIDATAFEAAQGAALASVIGVVLTFVNTKRRALKPPPEE